MSLTIGDLLIKKGGKMKNFQAYNRKTRAWVEYQLKADGKSEIKNVKEWKPQIPFKGIPKRGQRK